MTSINGFVDCGNVQQSSDIEYRVARSGVHTLLCINLAIRNNNNHGICYILYAYHRWIWIIFIYTWQHNAWSMTHYYIIICRNLTMRCRDSIIRHLVLLVLGNRIIMSSKHILYIYCFFVNWSTIFVISWCSAYENTLKLKSSLIQCLWKFFFNIFMYGPFCALFGFYLPVHKCPLRLAMFFTSLLEYRFSVRPRKLLARMPATAPATTKFCKSHFKGFLSKFFSFAFGIGTICRNRLLQEGYKCSLSTALILPTDMTSSTVLLKDSGHRQSVSCEYNVDDDDDTEGR